MAQGAAAVYTVERFSRTPDDVVGELRTTEDGEPLIVRPKPEHKRV
jgi:hypothetical protein